MGRPLSILLIEDEPQECQEMIQCIESTNDVHLVGVTNNVIQALEYVTDFLPDAIILDLELHKGYGNGLEFLNLLQKTNLSVPIYVLVTTHNISYVTHEGARKMGADFIMVKSQEDYSAKSVIDFLSSLKSIIHGNRKVAAQSDTAESPQQKQQRIVKRIITDLDRIGIPPNAMGRGYLIDGITLIINGQNEKICAALSAKYAKTEASVERAMQNAIEKAWRTAPIDDLEKYYTARINSVKGVPTLTEFMYYYAEKITNG
ncbi:MAG: response regulator [Peptococcaceae bacterium]|nr:response regulator [Peptococcaceae bacterium]